jgi:hypothetical protein
LHARKATKVRAEEHTPGVEMADIDAYKAAETGPKGNTTVMVQNASKIE